MHRNVSVTLVGGTYHGCHFSALEHFYHVASMPHEFASSDHHCMLSVQVSQLSSTLMLFSQMSLLGSMPVEAILHERLAHRDHQEWVHLLWLDLTQPWHLTHV